MNHQSLSFVVCTYNGASRLKPTLNALANVSLSPGQSAEVIIVDNASTDNSGVIASTLWSRSDVPLNVVSEPKQGLMHARIAGAVQSSYEIISFIDDDNWVSPDWVQSALEVFNSNSEIGVCGTLATPEFEGTEPKWWVPYHRSFACGEQARKRGVLPGRRNNFYGSGITFRKTAWEAAMAMGPIVLVGRRGNQLLSGEETEVCYRLCLLNWKFFYEPKLKLIHWMSESRMTDNYLTRMMSGNGYSGPVHFIYVEAIENQGKKRGLTARLKLTVPVHIVVRIRYCIKALWKSLFFWNGRALDNRLSRGRSWAALKEIVLHPNSFIEARKLISNFKP